MSATRWCLLLALLFLGTTVQQARSQRLLVKVDGHKTSSCIERAQQHGMKVLGSAHGLLVLSTDAKEAGSRVAADHVKSTIVKIQSWPGVQHVEEDKPRYLQRTLLDTATAQQGFAMECSSRDKAMSTNMLPEYMPYGISQIQADSTKLPSSIDKSGVMVCIIDSGIDAGHPDLQGNSLDGCKYEDAFAPGGCPFKWSEDYISHGSHVAGTIAAKKDGQGLIGVIPNGAELYIVRVFNDSGDVNQGQGLVYGGTLILAFTQCEGRLAAMQVSSDGCTGMCAHARAQRRASLLLCSVQLMGWCRRLRCHAVRQKGLASLAGGGYTCVLRSSQQLTAAAKPSSARLTNKSTRQQSRSSSSNMCACITNPLQNPCTSKRVTHSRCLCCCTAALLQARFPERQYRMVVSMSLGAPGPLTIEQLFFR